MGEKSGGLTNMIITLVALVAILLIINVAFPELTSTITEGMGDVVDKALGDATGEIIN